MFGRARARIAAVAAGYVRRRRIVRTAATSGVAAAVLATAGAAFTSVSAAHTSAASPAATAASTATPCGASEWTGTAFLQFPLTRLSTAIAYFEPRRLPGSESVTATVNGGSIDLNVQDNFAGAIVEHVISGVTAARAATITMQMELTGTLFADNPGDPTSPFTASVSGDTNDVGEGLTFSGAPLTRSTIRTFQLTGSSFDCATGELTITFAPDSIWVSHRITLRGIGAGLPPIPHGNGLTPYYEESCLDKPQFAVSTAPMTLYRRWGGTSGKVGFFWSRTNYPTAAQAKRFLALPPGNPAKRLAIIRVPPGAHIYWCLAAPQDKWHEPGGGNQVILPNLPPQSWFRNGF